MPIEQATTSEKEEVVRSIAQSMGMNNIAFETGELNTLTSVGNADIYPYASSFYKLRQAGGIEQLEAAKNRVFLDIFFVC